MKVEPVRVCLAQQEWQWNGARRRGETVLFKYPCCKRAEVWTQVSQETAAVKGHFTFQTSGRIKSETYLGRYKLEYPGIVDSLAAGYGCKKCTEPTTPNGEGRSGYN